MQNSFPQKMFFGGASHAHSTSKPYFTLSVWSGCAVFFAMVILSFAALMAPSYAETDKAPEDSLFPSLLVENPYVFEPVKGANVAAGMMKITNHTDQDNALVFAVSEAAQSVELHAMSMDDDIMRMRKMKSIAVPANSTTDFSMETGDHLMFINMTTPYVAGQVVPVTLTFENGASVDVQMHVIKRGDTPADAPKAKKQDHHSHSSHNAGHSSGQGSGHSSGHGSSIKNGAEADSAVDIEALHNGH